MDNLSLSVSVHLKEDLTQFKTIQKSKFTPNLILATFSAALGGFANGTVLSYTSPALFDMQRPNNPVHLLNSEKSWFGSLATVGALFGANAAGWAVEHVGRKFSIIISNAIICIGWLMITYSNELSVLYVGRLFTGFGMSCNTMIIPIYLVEISPPKIRGIIYTACPLFVALGILFTYSMGIFITWHWLAAVDLLFPSLSIILMLWMPESPSWLMKRGREEEIPYVLEWLRQSKETIDEEYLILNRNVINQQEISWTTLSGFWSKSVQKPLGICLLLMIFQQFSGYNAIIFYSSNIFANMATSLTPQMSSVFIGLAKVFPLCFTCFVIDFVGRKKLLLFSCAFTFMSTLLIGICKYIETYSTNKIEFITNYGFVSLIGFVIFIITFSMGLGPVPWLVMSEILPLRAKGISYGIATCVNWLCAFIVTKEFDDLNNLLHFYGTFWIFSSFCFTAFLVTWFCVPETKDRSHSEIETFFT